MKQEVTIPQMRKALVGKTLAVKQTFADGRERVDKYIVDKILVVKEWGYKGINIISTDGKTIDPLRCIISDMILAGGYYKWERRFGLSTLEYTVEGGL